MNLGGTVRLNKLGACVLFFLVLLFFLYAFKTSRSASDKSDLVDLRRLLIGSIEAAIEGGRKVLSVYNSTNLNIRSKGQTKEGANDPVTNADMLSHCAMYYSLTHTFPRIPVISEEKSSEAACPTSHRLELDSNVLKTKHDLPEHLESAASITVWIDPLDATQEFTEGLVEYVTTMVCVAVNGVPTLGVIHSPFSGSTTWAWVGQTTVKSHANAPKKIKVITSRSHKGDVTAVVNKSFNNDVEVIAAGGAGFKSLQVASGNVTAYIHTTQIKKWDICAGDAVLRALGGRMSTLHGKDIDYTGSSDVVNEHGILATLTNHDWFLNKLSPYINLT